MSPYVPPNVKRKSAFKKPPSSSVRDAVRKSAAISSGSFNIDDIDKLLANDEVDATPVPAQSSSKKTHQPNLPDRFAGRQLARPGQRQQQSFGIYR